LIPQELITRFKNQLAAAKALLSEVKPAGRNSINTEQCRIAFRDLELTMLFFKANYFNSPPRTADEVIALLLSLHDGSSTPILPSDVVPGLSLHNTDGHGMLVKLFMDAIPSDKRGADHCFGKWGLKLAGRWATLEEAAAGPRLLTRPPNQAADLPMHFSTSRKCTPPRAGRCPGIRRGRIVPFCRGLSLEEEGKSERKEEWGACRALLLFSLSFLPLSS
jgi:hypothetical protein